MQLVRSARAGHVAAVSVTGPRGRNAITTALAARIGAASMEIEQEHTDAGDFELLRQLASATRPEFAERFAGAR